MAQDKVSSYSACAHSAIKKVTGAASPKPCATVCNYPSVRGFSIYLYILTIAYYCP